MCLLRCTFWLPFSNVLFFFWKGSDALLAVTICLEPFWLPASNLYCPHEHACPLHKAFVFKGKTGSVVSVSMLRHCLINLATKRARALVEFGSEGRLVGSQFCYHNFQHRCGMSTVKYIQCLFFFVSSLLTRCTTVLKENHVLIIDFLCVHLFDIS